MFGQMTLKRFSMILVLGVILAVSGHDKGIALAAAPYPNTTIKILCHQSVGGSVDTTARVLAEFASKRLNVPMVIDNVTGAGGRQAFTQLFTSKPDGYVLATVNSPTIQIGQLAFQGAYKSNEFTYVYGYIDTGHVLAVNEKSPIKTLEDLVKKLKAGRTTIATMGKGSSSHLQMAAFLEPLGVSQNGAYVHFEGSAPQLTALLGGNTDVALTGYGAYAKSAQGLRALAAFDNQRDGFLKEVPIVAELGHRNVPVINQVWGFIAPPGMKAEEVKKLADAFDQGVQDKGVIEKFGKIALTPSRMMPEKFKTLAAEHYDLTSKYLGILQK
jgi:tripartite-type tricarboxylate transporter receptor subunit TctC